MLIEFWSQIFGRLGKNPRQTRCLDIASGTGSVLQCAEEHLSNETTLLCGLDSSAQAIQQLKHRLPNVAGIVANASSIPIESQSVDLVTSQFGVEYAGFEGILEAARVVREGGALVFLLHCRPGAIYSECSSSVEVIDRLQQARFFPLARAMFKAGFAFFQGGERYPYERAAHKFRSSFRLLDRLLSKYGQGVASGFVLRLRDDVARISQRLQHHDRKEVFEWIERLNDEMLSYRLRMKSMAGAAVDRKTLERIQRELSELGFSSTEAKALSPQDGAGQLAWSLEAHRTSANLA